MAVCSSNVELKVSQAYLIRQSDTKQMICRQVGCVAGMSGGEHYSCCLVCRESCTTFAFYIEAGILSEGEVMFLISVISLESNSCCISAIKLMPECWLTSPLRLHYC